MGDRPQEQQLDLADEATGQASIETSTVDDVQPGLFPDDTVPDELVGYRVPTACQIAGITYRQLDYWARTNLVVPSIRGAAGSGSQRLYSFKDILVLKIVKRLLDRHLAAENPCRGGPPAPARCRRSGAHPSSPTAPPSTSARLRKKSSTCCRVVRACSDRGQWRDAELTGTIADFPAERADGGEATQSPEDELASRRKNRGARKTG